MKQHDNKLQWHKECLYGLPQHAFETTLDGDKFSEISKSFRQTYTATSTNTLESHSTSPFFQLLTTQHPFVKWKYKMTTINNTRVKAECKTVFWRVLSNNLYLGERAFNYLKYKNPHKRDKYELCPYCTTNTPSTIEHQMWSCPCIAPLWTLVLNSLDAASIPHTIHSFNDLFLYIEKGNLSDLTLIIRDQMNVLG